MTSEQLTLIINPNLRIEKRQFGGQFRIQNSQIRNQIMAINYKVSKCKNPKGVEGTEYFSNKASNTSDYSFEDLAQDIAHSTTCTKADALAVLASIKPFIKNALLAGRRVVLNDLGAFIMGVRGKCYNAERMATEDFSPSAMKKPTQLTKTS